MANSDYEKVKERLKSAKCPKCQGRGEYDDAEPGDTWFNTFKCGYCDGTGFKLGKQQILVTTIEAVPNART